MGEWISLMDYAMKKGVSLSTLRRYIKAGKVQYRVENGRYLLLVEAGENLMSVAPASAPKASPVVTAPAANGDFLMTQLQLKLKKAQEEIAELKTLIAFYEESLGLATKTGAAPSPYTNHFNG